MSREQFNLFGPGPSPAHGQPGGLPEGFRYQSDLLSPGAEAELLERVRGLPFEAFEFHGHTGKRRVVSYGWRYEFAGRGALLKADDIPPFLLPLREAVARIAGLAPAELKHVLVTEYGAGAGIGWHRDKGVFGEVVGISLLAPCIFRLRRKSGATWERASLTAEPRSAYLLSGPARTEWEHSIPGVESLRYSVTFRNVRGT